MSSSFFYSLREGLDGFRRAKLASFIALMTMTFALLLLGVLTIATVNLVSLGDALKSRIEFEVFIDNALDDAGIVELQQQVQRVRGVAEAQFISKEEAAKIFKEAFARAGGKDGTTFLDVLDANPLPASFRITLQKSFQNSASAQRVAADIEKLPGVDEVVYRRDLAEALDRYLQWALLIGLGLGLLFCAGAFMLVINDVRLVIHAKRRLIEIMQLVGATRAFVRRPLLMQGFLLGTLGGLIASGGIYLVHRLLLFQLGAVQRLPQFFFVGLVGAGILLGITGSFLGARKYIQ
ncbi:MAG: ABC transporter permease [candidate division KSB1 bacterium]|nr:ABC transporter permease [candidate division KSB1 bacterium]MDZ7366032.1 ABC transporter permease [candidate division KSB1 bacterium]MDZ7404149.1 ABC transporter permease [candidate division KSB1 bacterium]